MADSIPQTPPRSIGRKRQRGTPRRDLPKAFARLLQLLLLAALSAAGARAADGPVRPRLESGIPFLRHFSAKEYKANPRNSTALQDPRGIVYVANNDGVLEFDGVRWRLIQTPNQTVVRSMAMDAGGRVFVGAVGEIGCLEPDHRGRMQFVSFLDRIEPAKRLFGDVWGTAVTADGAWFLSWKYLFRIQGRTVQSWTTETSFRALFNVNERLFIRESGRGLLEWRQGAFQLIPGGERFADELVDAMVGLDPPGTAPGRILVGTRLRGLFLLEGDRLAPFPTEADGPLAEAQLRCGVRLPDGSLAFGTNNSGLFLLSRDGRLIGHLDRFRGLADENVKGLFVDAEHGLWMALDRGLTRLELGNPVTRFDERTGLRGAVLTVSRHGEDLYAGTTHGLFHLESGQEAKFTEVASPRTQTRGFARFGDRLLVANNNGVFEVRGDRTVPVLVTDRAVVAFLVSKVHPGRIFIGLQNGLVSVRWEKGRWVEEGRDPELKEEVVTLSEDPMGRIWVATYTAGLFRYTFPAGWRDWGSDPARRLERFGAADGLPELNPYRGFCIDGAPLFGTRAGVFAFDEAARRFHPAPAFAGLFGKNRKWVFNLRQDRLGRVWISTAGDTGLAAEHGIAQRGPDGAFAWVPEALPVFEGAWTDMDLDPDGVMWLAGVEGLFRYDPRRSARLFGMPKVLIREVTAGGRRVLHGGAGTPSAPPEIRFAENSLRFEYALPLFDGLDAVRYQVRLEGYDKDWTAWTAAGYKEYTNLVERRYRFLVRAMDLRGRISPVASYEFRVLSPWYRTWWAFLGSLLVLGGAGWGGVRWRVRRLLKAQQELEEKVLRRTEDLARKTAQLETQNAIVRSINDRTHLDDLMAAILSECQVIDGVESALALVAPSEGSGFTCRASLGREGETWQGRTFSAGELQATFLAGVEVLAEGMFLRRGDPASGNPQQATLVMRVGVAEEGMAFLVFTNSRQAHAFDGADIALLDGLRQHFVSALQKARTLGHLETALAHSRDSEAALKTAKESAESATRAKSTFLANMSHEIRTPLNAILGFSEVLRKDPTLDGRQRGYLDLVHSSGQALLRLISDILDLSKIEAGRLEVERAPVPLRRMLQELQQVLALRAQGKGLRLVLAWSEGTPEAILGDGQKLRQVLMNLLGNAIKFTPQGQVTLGASLVPGASPTLSLWVRDTGPGLAEGDLERLFQPFEQASAGRRSRQGTGLGLALSRRLVEAMGGQLRVESQPGRGSRFEVRLEQLQAIDLPEPGSAAREPQRLLHPPHPPDVVIADDHQPTLEVYRALLGPLGLRLHTAEDGGSALALVREVRPGLCILDLHMPGLDGYETARAIRAMEGMPRPFLLACSASVLEEDAPAARSAGFDAFLPKPFQVTAFAALMEARHGWRFAWIEPGPVAPEAGTDLGRCPAELEGPLREALLIGDLGRITALVGELAPLNGPLAAQANRLLQAFDLVGLEALLFGPRESPPAG